MTIQPDSKMPELMPCPFCGAKPLSNDDFLIVCCSNSECDIYCQSINLKQWNKRADLANNSGAGDANADRINEALEEFEGMFKSGRDDLARMWIEKYNSTIPMALKSLASFKSQKEKS